MISSQRQHLILSRLRTRGAVRITALSKELGVSAMTIRRDIAELADKGLLKRVHGGAVTTSTLLSEPLFSVKSQMDIGLKDAIAQEAIKYVAPGDVIAVGGGTTGGLWPQIVSDVTGLAQDITQQSMGACYGDAMLAGVASGIVERDAEWTSVARRVEPNPEAKRVYDELYAVYRELHPRTADLQHRLAALQTSQ